MNFLRQARVAAVNPKDNSVDLVMVDDGSRFPGVQVVSMTALTDCGTVDLPNIAATSDKWSLSAKTERNAIALVGFIAPTLPVVLGFLFPQVNGVLFDEQDRRVQRHASDFYETIDASANWEMFHPSGTYVRIGTSPAHEDLTGKDFDKNWKVSRNTDKQVHLKISVANGGAERASIAIDPSGNITVQCDGNMVMQVDGNLSATVQGTTQVTSSGAATLTAPSVKVDSPQSLFTGALTVQGLFTYQAGMQGSGGGSSAASITGNVNITGNFANTGTLTNNGTNVGSTHRHGGVQTGSGNTGTPT